MSAIKLTHGPDQCCECVPHLESQLRDALEENKRLRDALEKISREANLDDAMFGVIDKIANSALSPDAGEK